MAEYFTTSEQRELFAEFINENHMLFGSSKATLVKALSTVDNNIEWADQNLNRLNDYLVLRNRAADLKLGSALLMIATSILNFCWFFIKI